MGGLRPPLPLPITTNQGTNTMCNPNPNPPTFRLTPGGGEAWVLTANADCLTCRGSGEIREAHGEVLDCDCCFDQADRAVVEAIDAGAAYIIEPDPRWVAFMDQMCRALRGGE